ncbi:MAG: TolR protein [Bacteriovoracaceae bacterium]|nr:TolR protein [Bacteriovoracaceae bacterium]
MGVSVESSSKGRKKVDSELNLIPFIDLLSVCLLFLLMTAVWVQISKMSAFSQPSGETTITHSDVSSITKAKEDRDFEVLIRTDGVQVVADQKTLAVFPVFEAKDALLKLQASFGKIENPKISLRAADDVVYENVIMVLDSLFSMKLTNITIGGLN